MTTTEKAVEAMARAYGRKHGPLGVTLEAELERQDKTWRRYREEMETALSALISLHPGIASVIDGTGVVVEISTLREVERLSRSSCLVPPDGGEPTEQEAHISNVCGNIIREMADRATLAAAEKEKQG